MIVGDVRVVFQAQHGQVNLVGRIAHQRSHAVQILIGLHSQDFHLIDGAVCIVQYDVDRPRQVEDVFAVKRRDKGANQFVDQNAANLVGLFLDTAHVGRRDLLRHSPAHLRQPLRAARSQDCEETKCVALTGPPVNAAPRIITADVACAVKPCTGRILGSLPPSVRISRQPPVDAPSANAAELIAVRCADRWRATRSASPRHWMRRGKR